MRCGGIHTQNHHLLIAILDVLLAAHFAAWYCEFATAARAKTSLANMETQPQRVRIGVLACSLGMMLIIAGLAIESAGNVGLGQLVNLAGYPPLLFGPVALASATWTPKHVTAPVDAPEATR